jgi:L-fuconolactonase
MHIDAHQHFWRYDPARDTWITEDMAVLKRDYLPADLLPVLDANHMDACIAVQADQSERDTAFLLELAERTSRIAGVVGWTDLTSPEPESRLRYFSRFDKLCGFRHVAQSEPDDRFLMRPEFTRGIARLREFDFTYDILIYPKQLPAAIDLASKFPDQRFVLDHLAKPEIKAKNIDRWATQIRAIAAGPNVYCKLSGLVTEADWRNWRPGDFDPYLDVIFDAFTADRLMFGSDWPVCLCVASYRQVKQLIEDYVDRGTGAGTCSSTLQSSAKEKIFGANAIRFYGLKGFSNGPAT